MTTSVGTGSESYYKQLAALQSLPNNAASLAELTKLSNDPRSPFQQFLVQGKIDQITKNMAAQKGLQAQAQVGGGLPTIKQKQDQAAQLLLAQAAMAGKGAMPHPMMQAQPAQNQQQDQEEPEEMPAQTAAYGGIMHAPVHEHMFNFAPGGIVAFSGKDDQRVIDEAKNQTDAYLAGLELQNQANAAPPGETSYTPAVGTPAPAPAPAPQAAIQAAPQYQPLPPKAESTAGELFNALGLDKFRNFISENVAQHNMTDQAQWDQKPGMFEKLTPDQRKARLDAMNSTLSGATQGLQPRVVTDPTEIAKLEAARTGQAASAAPAGIPGIVTAAPAAPGGINTGPVKPPGGINTGPVKPPASNIGTHPGNPATSPAAALPATSEESVATKDYHDQQNARLKAEQDLLDDSKPKGRDELIKSELELQKLFHIGDYEKLTKDLLAERERRHNEDKAGRGYNDAMAQLAAFARPGARWSDVIGTDVRNKAGHQQEDKEFYDAQDKYLDAINKAAEARNEGSVSRIHAAELEQTKARHEAVKEVMKSKDMGLNAAEHYVATLTNNAVNMFGHQVQEKVGMAQAAAANNRADIAQQNADTQKIKAILSTDITYKKYSELIPKLQQQLNFPNVSDEFKKGVAAQLKTAQDYVTNSEIKAGLLQSGGIPTVQPNSKPNYKMVNGQIVPA